jgi:hypothetical protein
MRDWAVQLGLLVRSIASHILLVETKGKKEEEMIAEGTKEKKLN